MRGERPRRRRGVRGVVAVVAVVAALFGALAPISVVTSRAAGAASAPIRAREIRSLFTGELGIGRPDAVAYTSDHTLLVSETRDGTSHAVRLTPTEDVVGLLRVPDIAAGTLAFDQARNRLTGLGRAGLRSVDWRAHRSGTPPTETTDITGVQLRDPGGSTFDPRTGAWLVLDRGAGNIARIGFTDDRPVATRISPRGLDARRLQGIAFNPGDGLVYVVSPSTQQMYGLDGTGDVKATIDLRDLQLKNPRAIAFAPTPDKTDSASATDVFIADSGDAASMGRVVEATIAPGQAAAAAAPTTIAATFVRTIATNQFSPASPDPSGIAYLPGPDRLEISDSEVEEQTGAGWHNVNLWQTTRTGTVSDTGTTSPTYSNEPTGLGYQPSTNSLCVSDDNANRVFLVRPGGDGRFGNADDQRSFVRTTTFGSDDAEDCDINTLTGHLLVSDGVNREVYDIDPVNGTFGDADDAVTQFDLQQYGVQDPEGIAHDPARNVIVIADRAGKRLYEVTVGGAYLRTITFAAATPQNPADVTVAPASGSPAQRNYYVVDRMGDNGSNPNENDGKAYELSVPGPSDAPPTVTVTSPTAGSTVAGTVRVDANANDDLGVDHVQFFVDGVSIGTDTSGVDGWSVSWDTTVVPDGDHLIGATATDTIGQTGSNTITARVENVDSPPAVTITSPTPNATVVGTIDIQAAASDDRGVDRVGFFVDGASIATDTNGADGWSASWNSSSVVDGNHTLNATATDTTGQSTTSAAVPVVVNNAGTPGVLDVAIAASLDDVEERANGRMWVATSDLDLVTDTNPDDVQKVGLRYALPGVPRGATVTNAYVQFQVDKVNSEPTDLAIQGQAADNAPSFTLTNLNVSSRPRTVASVAWTPVPWTRANDRTVAQRTPNLATVLQEIVNRPSWSPGNAAVLIITGSGRRTADSFDGSFAPVLHVEYAPG